MASFGRSEPIPPTFPDREESPPPPQEDTSGDSVVGLQLIVSGLEQQNTWSAAAHLHRILKNYQEKESNPPLPPILITASDSRTPVDYVYLSIDPSVSGRQRPPGLTGLKTFGVFFAKSPGFGPGGKLAMDQTGPDGYISRQTLRPSWSLSSSG